MIHAFDYKQSIKLYRKQMDCQVAAFVNENPQLSYRKIAKLFRIDLITLFNIVKAHGAMRRKGPRAKRVVEAK
jgi:hypothetical protein